jgi:hypothetical protein
MEMIPHDDKGVQTPAESRGRLEEHAFKRRRRICPRKQIAPMVAPVEHMIAGTGKFEPQFSRHDTRSCFRKDVCQ